MVTLPGRPDKRLILSFTQGQDKDDERNRQGTLIQVRALQNCRKNAPLLKKIIDQVYAVDDT